MDTYETDKQGFTLIALLIVVAIIAVIAGLIFYRSPANDVNLIETKKNAENEIKAINNQVNNANTRINRQMDGDDTEELTK